MDASVGKEIVSRLRDFKDALKKKEPVFERFTCKRVILDLQPTTYNAEMVKQTRKMLGASQAVFAQFLGVSRGTVRGWELGANSPKDIACRFMDEIRRNPGYWTKRLRESAIVKKPAKL